MQRIYFFVLAFYFTSCHFYSPMVSAPVLVEKKREIQIDAGYSSETLIPKVQASIAYSFTDNIYTQIFASMSGANNIGHLQALAGYKFQIDSLNSLRVSGGYAKGANLGENTNFYVSGNYQSAFGKIQYTNIGRNTKKNLWGSTLILSVLSPNLKTYHNQFLDKNPIPADTLNQGRTPEYKLVTQKGLIIEPSIFYHRNFSKRFGMTFSFSLVKIIPLNQRDGDSPNQYKLNYYPVTLGANFSYTFRK